MHGTSLEELKKKSALFMMDVHKRYGSHTVLEDIDLAVSDGEFVTIVGPSGCGKSTLFRLILGQETPTAGKIYIAGEPVGPPDPTRGIVYQKYSLFPHLRVIDNVLLGKKLQLGILEFYRRRKQLTAEAMAYLEKVGIGGHAEKFPHELSGGMQQRVAIAQSLIMKPKILLMDEPFGALDPFTRESLQVFLLQLWEENKMTVFFVTHDLEEALFLGTRILVLSQFYSDGRGKSIRRGARIVHDLPLAFHAMSTDFKKSSEIGALIQQIRQEGFDPKHLQHVLDFNLEHPNSFRTLKTAEINRT